MNAPEVTGRDAHLVTRALALAIQTIPHLPVNYRPDSDREDMLKLIRTMDDATVQLDIAEHMMAHLNEGDDAIPIPFVPRIY